MGPNRLQGRARRGATGPRGGPVGRRRCLVVLARWPSPGRCKRRLAAGLGCGGTVLAARIQARLLRHTLAVAQAASSELGFGLVLAVDGLGPGARRRWGQQLGVDHLCDQGPGGLGVRMQRQWQRAFGAGADQVVLIGTDLPDLAGADLAAAFRGLDGGPLVLGPAQDGGYWLIGLNRPGFARAGAALMVGQPWGTAAVFEGCLRAAGQRGLAAQLLRCQSDLDRRADLAPWLDCASPARWPV